MSILEHLERNPVVIVGGGLGGSAAALFLAAADQPVVVLERHPAPTSRPRAWIISARSMELLQQVGVAEQVLQAGTAGGWRIQVASKLLDIPIGDQIVVDETAAISTLGGAMCDQDVLEEILRARAEQLGARFHPGETATDLLQSDGSVDVRTARGGSFPARYVVLAEGARAGLAQSLGIGSSAMKEDFGVFHQVLFRSDELDALMHDRSGKAFLCTDERAIIFRRDLGRWQIQRMDGDFDDVREAIARAVGQPVDIDVLDHGAWRPAARLADRFRAGDVFVIGDAVHAMPPSLGMAGNLAIADAHALAWRLDWVLRGHAGVGLLDSYEPERRAVDGFVLDQSVRAMRGEQTLDHPTIELGLGYPTSSPALQGQDHAVTVTDPRLDTPVIGGLFPRRRLPGTPDAVTLDTSAFTAIGAPCAPTDRIRSLPSTQPDLEPEEVWLVRPDGHIAARTTTFELQDVVDQLLDLH